MRIGGRDGELANKGASLRLRAMRTLRRLNGGCRGRTFARSSLVARRTVAGGFVGWSSMTAQRPRFAHSVSSSVDVEARSGTRGGVR